MGKLVSMREYARIRGVNLNAVQTAIKSGRIHKTRDDKIDINEANELPLYTYLKAQKGFAGFGNHKFSKLLGDMLAKEDKDWDKKPDIKWNFTKFLINRAGEVVARFEPTADMKEVEVKIQELI